MEGNQCVSSEIKADLKEKYSSVRTLLAKEDPETEPYRSKYAAMEILKSMQNLLFNSVDNAKQQETEVRALLAVIYMNKGIIAIETEELSDGEKYLMDCIDTIDKNEIKPETILPMISALNQLGILWSKRDQPSKAKEYLERAEKAYKDYQNLKDSILTPINMTKLFDIIDPEEPSGKDIIEKLHTLTLYYIGQIYECLDDYLKSAVYFHMTLKRQLEMNDYESIDWALNTATLSQFFMEKGGFHEARHHLAAATYILNKYEDNLKEISLTIQKDDNSKEVLDAKWENFRHRRADISRCWAKYGIYLMNVSRDRLLSISEDEESKPLFNSTHIQTDPNSDISQECLNNLKFQTLEKDIEYIINNITDKFLLDFKDAKKVFFNVQKWLDDAKTFYNLESQASDYVKIIQDMSQLYKYLIFFEDNESNHAKMHKRRIDLLEGLVKELNERYYLSICRQIWLELGEIYSEILDIKLYRLISTQEKPTPQLISKINNLKKSAIHYFTKFIDSVKGKGSEKFSEEMVRPVLCSYFHLGRIYNKFIKTDSKKIQLENAQKSLDAYMFLVNYCEKDLKAAELMSAEINICKDLVKLLPVKINKLHNEISRS